MSHEPRAMDPWQWRNTECKTEEREKLKGNDKPTIYWWNFQIKYELHDIQIVSCCALAKKSIAQNQNRWMRWRAEEKKKTDDEHFRTEEICHSQQIQRKESCYDNI